MSISDGVLGAALGAGCTYVFDRAGHRAHPAAHQGRTAPSRSAAASRAGPGDLAGPVPQPPPRGRPFLVTTRVLEVRRGDGTYVTSLEPALLLEGSASRSR